MEAKKIVYNACFGGFGLSASAYKRYCELVGRPCYFFVDKPLGPGRIPVTVDEAEESHIFYAYDVPNPDDLPDDERNAHRIYLDCEVKRDDPALVQTVEELGEKANGMCANLRITALPFGTSYRIDEYDGNERVMTAGDYDWETA